jgi:hypothetical protein
VASVWYSGRRRVKLKRNLKNGSLSVSWQYAIISSYITRIQDIDISIRIR